MILLIQIRFQWGNSVLRIVLITEIYFMPNASLIYRDFSCIPCQSYSSQLPKNINDGAVACDGPLVNVLVSHPTLGWLKVSDDVAVGA
jgi:hypothetical protein